MTWVTVVSRKFQEWQLGVVLFVAGNIANFISFGNNHLSQMLTIFSLNRTNSVILHVTIGNFVEICPTTFHELSFFN